MSKKTIFWIRTVIAVIVLSGIDQISKLWALDALSGGDIVVWDGVFRFSLVKNTGGVFGMFSGATVVLTVITSLILIGIIFFTAKLPVEKKYNALRVVAVFIMAGAVGNLLDRIAYGFVVDFLYIELINFYVFNVADCYITISVFVTVLLMLVKYRNDEFDFLKRKTKKIKVAEDAEISEINTSDAEDGGDSE